MARKVRWSRSAKNELSQVVSYWNKRNQSSNYTNKLRRQIEVTLNLIKVYPNSGRRTISNGIRRIIVIKKYAIFYDWTKSHVNILAFWDVRQDPRKSKFEIT